MIRAFLESNDNGWYFYRIVETGLDGEDREVRKITDLDLWSEFEDFDGEIVDDADAALEQWHVGEIADKSGGGTPRITTPTWVKILTAPQAAEVSGLSHPQIKAICRKAESAGHPGVSKHGRDWQINSEFLRWYCEDYRGEQLGSPGATRR